MSHSLLRFTALAGALLATPAAAQHPASAVGTLVVAHGGGPAWDASVDGVAAMVRTGGPVAVSFLMGPGATTRRLRCAPRRCAASETIALQQALTGKDVVVVPILVSSGTVSRSELPTDLAGLPITYRATPLLPHPAMARWIESRVRGSLGTPPAGALAVPD